MIRLQRFDLLSSQLFYFVWLPKIAALVEAGMTTLSLDGSSLGVPPPVLT